LLGGPDGRYLEKGKKALAAGRDEGNSSSTSGNCRQRAAPRWPRADYPGTRGRAPFPSPKPVEGLRRKGRLQGRSGRPRVIVGDRWPRKALRPSPIQAQRKKTPCGSRRRTSRQGRAWGHLTAKHPLAITHFSVPPLEINSLLLIHLPHPFGSASAKIAVPLRVGGGLRGCTTGRMGLKSRG